jgi:hypothetical protein
MSHKDDRRKRIPRDSQEVIVGRLELSAAVTRKRPALYDSDGIVPPTIESWFALWGSYLLFILSGPIFFIGSAMIYVAFRNRLMGG